MYICQNLVSGQRCCNNSRSENHIILANALFDLLILNQEGHQGSGRSQEATCQSMQPVYGKFPRGNSAPPSAMVGHPLY